VGHLTWQGITQPDSRNTGLTATLTLCVSATPQVYQVTTDSSGTFSVTTGLAPGSYNWRLKGNRNLATSGVVTLSGTTNAEFGLQQAADADNNNTVNAQDFSILKATFGAATDLRADSNNDGIVNASDFSLLKSDFAIGGAVSNCP
jgi:hypothetical protein